MGDSGSLMLQWGGQSWGPAGVGRCGVLMVCVGEQGARRGGSLGRLVRTGLPVALGWCVALPGLLSSWAGQDHPLSTVQGREKDPVLLDMA